MSAAELRDRIDQLIASGEVGPHSDVTLDLGLRVIGAYVHEDGLRLEVLP